MIKTRPFKNNKNNRGKIIGILGDELNFNIPITILKTVKKLATQQNFKFLYFAGQPYKSPHNYQAQSNILYDMISKETVDGLIIISNLLEAYVPPDVFIEKCTQYLPLPTISLGIMFKQIPSVVLNNKTGMYKAVSHLIEVHNYHRIGFLSGPKEHPDVIERFQAFSRAMQDHNISVDQNLLFYGDFQSQSASLCIQDLIGKRKQIPGKDIQALVCCNDYMAVGAMVELQTQGFRVPEDIAIIGFDDMPHVRNLTPTLSTVRQPFDLMTGKAIDLLNSLLNGDPVPEVSYIDSEFISRRSCGCIHAPIQNNPDLIPESTTIVQHTSPPQFLQQINRQILTSNGTYIQIWQRALALLNDFDNWNQYFSRNNQAGDFGKNVWDTLGNTAFDAIQNSNYDMFTKKIGIALNSTLDLHELMAILKKMLPFVGIRRCYVYLYEDPADVKPPHWLPPWSRMILGFDQDGDVTDLPPDGLRTATKKLIPGEIIRKKGRYSWIIVALYFQEEQIGFMLMDSDAPNVNIFHLFRNQLSGSLKGVLLLKGYQDYSRKLMKASEKIKKFNEQLKSENMRIKTEMEVARSIQTALLPKLEEQVHQDFEISATMLTATEVGGDYYDIALDERGNLWLGIGDVSGHGLKPGLIMMLAQTVHTTITTNLDTDPGTALQMMNKVLVKNVNGRMKEDNYMTCILLKYLGAGRFQFAGMHLDLLIYRQAQKKCERIPSNGAWLNLIQDIAEYTGNSEFVLEIGDVLVLYTDGITETINKEEEMLELNGLEDFVVRHGEKRIKEMKSAIMQDVLTWNDGNYMDDMTLLLVRRIR